ncbi:hypothetical protein Emag_003331 [Eimeria magna]
MEALQTSPPSEPRLAVSKFHLQWEPEAFTSLRRKSRPSHSASHSSYLTTSYAVVLLSLTVAYLLWRCFRSLYLDSCLGSTARALAAGKFPAEACTGETENVESKEAAAGAESRDSSERRGSASSKGGRGARGDAASSRYPQPKPIAGNWALQQMPLEWEEKTRRSLHKFRDLAVRCASLVNILSPEDSVNLISHMAALTCVELGGFGNIPPSLQGVRWNAGRALVALIERIFRESHLRMAAIATGSEERLGRLRSLIKEVCELPPIVEGITRKRFKESLVRHWELNRRATQHLAYHLDMLLSLSREPGSGLQARFEMVMRVVRALLETRKMQVAGDGVLRRWLKTCEEKIARNLLYTQEEYKQAPRERISEVSGQLQQITTAVVRAGGSAVVPSFFSSFPSSTQTSSPAQSSLFSAEASEEVEAHQRQQQPAFSQEYSHGASRVRVQQQRSQQTELPPLLASMRLLRSQEAFEPPYAGEYYNILGARPRRSSSREMREANVHAEAQALGWGPGAMPPQVAAQVLIVLDRVERVATTCSLILSSLTADDAVLLSMSLAKWAATEIASFPLVPPDIQEKRRCAAMSYVALIDQIMHDAVTYQAATRLGVDRDLSLLARLHQGLMNPQHEGPQLNTMSYMRVLMTAWRLSNYSSRSVQGLVSSLWPMRNVRGTSRGKAHVVSQVIAALSKLRTSQLLKDFETGRWFFTCHQNLTPGFMYTDEQFKDARRAEPVAVERELDRITRTVNKAHQSAAAAEKREASTDFGDGASSHGQKQEASATGASRQQPSSPQPRVRLLRGRPKAGEKARQPPSLPQILEAFSVVGHGSSAHEQQKEKREPRPLRLQQPPSPQPPVSGLLRRFKAGEKERQSSSSPQTLEASSGIRPGPSASTQVELNPLAPEFSPQHSLGAQSQAAHTVLDSGSDFWLPASTPPTPAPPRGLPPSYHQPVPAWLDPHFPLALAQAGHGSLAHTSSELPPHIVSQPHHSSFFTPAHFPPHQLASEFHPNIADVPYQATFPAPWTYPGESFGVRVEEASNIFGGTVWVPQGGEEGHVSDLTSHLSALGVFEEEDRTPED